MEPVTPTDDPVTMVVDGAPATGRADVEAATGGEGPRRGWLPWVWASLVLALSVVAGLVFANGSERPDVQVVDWATDRWTAAPPAPTGPLTQRWSLPLPPERALVGMATLDDRVLLASHRTRIVSGREGGIVVAAHDATDGQLLWRHEVDGARTAVVVADDTSTTLLANMDALAHPRGQAVFDRSGITTLSPDGMVEWRRDLADDGGFGGGEGQVTVRPGGDLVVYDRDGVALLDPVTGEAVLQFPAVQDGRDEGEVRQAWLADGAWVVPTRAGWEIVDLDGATEFSIDGPRSRPQVHDALVVVTEGSVVTARRRPGGQVAWRLDVGHEVLWTSHRGGHHGAERGEDAVADPTGSDPIRIVAWVEDRDESTMSSTGLVIEDGDLVGEIDDETTGTPPAGWSRLAVEVDGAPRTVCRRLPNDLGVADANCPDELAIQGPDGQVLATADRVLQADVHPSLSWRPTDAGLLTIERDEVRLSRWEDLAESWSIPIEESTTRPVTVATTATGVAVASNGPGPAQVTWYR